MRKLITVMALLIMGCHKEPMITPEPTLSEMETVSNKTLINNIIYVGRWNNSHTYCGWGGCYIKTRFTGTATITVSDTELNYYWIIVDGREAVKHIVTHPGSFSVTANGTHELIVTQGRDYHYGFNLMSVQGVLNSSPQGKLVEWIGDSITAGYLDTKADVSDYAWIVSEGLNVEHTQIAYPGITLVNGMDGQYFMDRCKGGTKWNHNYTPNVVVVNLGTNDQNKGVSDEVFKASLKNFTTKLRSMYPNAEILLLRPFNGAKWGCIKTVTGQRKNGVDRKIECIDSSGWITKSETVDGLHPSDEGQKIISNKLKPILAKYL